MDKPSLLAIDQGTSATKCLLVDPSSAVISRGSAPLAESHPAPGWVEQNPDEIWASVQAAVRNCLEGQDASAVVAVGLSTQRESLLLWDRRTGEALSPLLSWQDQRTAALCDELRSPAHERLVRERSGLPLDPMFSAVKARWLLDTYDPDRKRSSAGEICLGTVDSWLLSRFSGQHLIEAGNASRTQLLDVRKVGWDAGLLELFGVPLAALPEVRPSVGPFPGVRGLHPLRDGTPLLAVMGDSHAALFGHGAFRPGQVKATYGTGSSVMGLVAEPFAPESGLCLTVAWQTDHPAYAAEGNIRASGAALRWLSDLLGITPQELGKLGAEADSDGVTIVPGFGGLGAPWWDREATGVISGLTLSSRRENLARAALDSVAQQVADLVEAVDNSVGRVEALYADGGPTRNAFLMQLQADLIGRPVLRSPDAELSALGAAHLAGLGAGVWTREGLEALPRQQDRFQPLLGATEREGRRAAWGRAIQQILGSSSGWGKLGTRDERQAAPTDKDQVNHERTV